MTFFPVVERELRAAARGRVAWWARVGACLLLLGLTAWLLWVAPGQFFDPQKTGRNLFSLLTAVAFLLCLASGVVLTADCLSREKRSGTLGLLFLTDLRAHEVVLGKLAATSIVAVYALLAVLPLLTLTLVLGGITVQAIIGMAVCLLNALWLSLTAGLLISALSRDERRAIAGVFVLLGVVTLGFPLLGLLVDEFVGLNSRQRWFELIAIPSPAYGYLMGLTRLIHAQAGSPPPAPFWYSQVWGQILGWLFLWIACAIAVRAWHDTNLTPVPEEASPSWWQRWQGWWFGTLARRRELRRRLLESGPLIWLTHRHRPRVLAPWIALGTLTLLWFAGALWVGVDWYNSLVAVAFAFSLQTGIKYQVAAESCRRFAEDRPSGALELLLSTPLTPEAIVEGHRLALRRIFQWPLVVLALVTLLLSLNVWRDAEAEAPHLTVAFVLSVVVTLLDCRAAIWLGMWLGLHARSYTVALSSLLSWILFIPWVICWGTLITFWSFRLAPRNEEAAGAVVLLVACWSAVVSVAMDVAGVAWARQRLRTRFHSEVTGLRTRRGRAG